MKKKIRLGILSLALCVNFSCTNASAVTPLEKSKIDLNQYAQAFVNDIGTLCNLVREKYYYFDKARAYWSQACEHATQSVSNVKDNWEGIAAFESLTDQLYESHLGFNKNLSNSPRLIPSGADFWVEENNDESKFFITSVRYMGAAALAGVQVNDQLVSYNGLSPNDLAKTRIQFGLNEISETRKQWALNAALAGNRAEPRELVVKRKQKIMSFSLAAPEPKDEPGNVQHKLLNNQIAYVRFSNSLGNSQTVKDFSNVVKELQGASAWILDLRNTNGGGGTSIAEPIMGHFFTQETLYQKTLYQNDKFFLPKIVPDKKYQITAPLVVLVGRWTGSMGEGMAIGFDGTKRGIIVGTKMARLAGGTEDFLLESTNTSVSFPTYDLLHLDGTPRHLWEPSIQISSDNGNSKDLALGKALDIIESLNK